MRTELTLKLVQQLSHNLNPIVAVEAADTLINVYGLKAYALAQKADQLHHILQIPDQISVTIQKRKFYLEADDTLLEFYFGLFNGINVTKKTVNITKYDTTSVTVQSSNMQTSYEPPKQLGLTYSQWLLQNTGLKTPKRTQTQ